MDDFDDYTSSEVDDTEDSNQDVTGNNGTIDNPASTEAGSGVGGIEGVEQNGDVFSTKDAGNGTVEGIGVTTVGGFAIGANALSSNNVYVTDVDGMNIQSKTGEIQSGIIDRYGDSMNNLGFRLTDYSGKVTGYTDTGYQSIFDTDKNVLGHTDMITGDIHVIAGSKDGTTHTLTHEMHHAASDHKDVTTTDEKEGTTSRTITAGLHDYTTVIDAKGNIISEIDTGRGLNEGITESLTIEFLKDHDPTAVDAYTAYGRATGTVDSLSAILGRDTFVEAYMNGDRGGLIDGINHYTNDPNGYSNLCDLIDKATYSEDAQEVLDANQQIEQILNQMAVNKAMEDMENENSKRD